jgi:hypothetical protein
MNRTMKLTAGIGLVLTLVVGLVLAPAWAANPAEAKPAEAKPAATKPAPPKAPELTDPGPFMGEYVGTYAPAGAAAAKAEAKVVGLKDEAYRVILSTVAEKEGDKTTEIELAGKRDGDKLVLSGKVGDAEWTGAIDAKQHLLAENKAGKFEMKFDVRKSPTEGQKPPAGAVVLLAFEEGKAPALDAWDNKTWIANPDGSMSKGKGDIKTVQKFADMQLHVEFMCPYMPAAGGQGRGNSGVYLQDRYEVQVLDSFGLKPAKNECGAVYGVGAPKVIASLPPLRWQTYDITFRAPKVEEGKAVKPGTVTVVQNGITIHENQELPGAPANPAGARGVVPTGPLKLQDHGNTVKYRNIWLVELKD